MEFGKMKSPNLRQRSLALREKLDDDTLSLQQYKTDAIAILSALYDAERAFQAVDVREDLNKRQAENARKLSQTILALEDATKDGQIERILDTAQERQRVLAGSEGALKVIYDRFVQLEQDSQDKLAGIILGGRVADARKELTRFEERALDASSQKQRENLIRETQQYVDMYSERGEAFRDLVADAQDLGSELQQAFDLTEQQKRLEDFRDGVADVINDLASVAVDHIFDGFFGAADEATAAIQVFTDLFRGDIELLENDVNRLTRQVEDSRIRLSRIDEDESRRIRQLERQRRSLLARAAPGNQRDAERTRQRAQDISFRISALREDFSVRRSRTQEDADRRRNRSIEDALQRRERAQAERPSLVGDIGQTLETAMKNALADRLSGYLTKTAFDTGVGLITAGLGALGIGDLLKGFLGGGSEGDGDGTGTGDQTPAQDGQGDGDTSSTTPPSLEGDADVDGTIKTLTVDPDLATPTVDVAGLIKSAAQATATEGYTVPSVDASGLVKSAVVDAAYMPVSIDVKGRITSAEVSEGSSLPSVPGLKGGISRIALQRDVQKPLVTGLIGTIGTLSITETLEDLPSAPGLEGRIDALTLLDDLSLPMAEGLAGRIDALTIATEATAGLSANIAGIINALTLEGTLPAVTGLTGTVDDILVSPDIDLPSIDGLHGIIDSIGTNFDAPQIDFSGVTATIDDLLLSTDIDTPTVTGLDGRIDSIALDPDIDLPTIRIAATVVLWGRGGDGRGQGGEDPGQLGSGLEGTISSLNRPGKACHSQVSSMPRSTNFLMSR